MTAQDFIQLNLKDQYAIIIKDGRLIDERAIYNVSAIELYYFHGFYVEAFFDAKTDYLQKITLTDEEAVLYWYVDLTILLRECR